MRRQILFIVLAFSTATFVWSQVARNKSAPVFADVTALRAMSTSTSQLRKNAAETTTALVSMTRLASNSQGNAAGRINGAQLQATSGELRSLGARWNSVAGRLRDAAQVLQQPPTAQRNREGLTETTTAELTQIADQFSQNADGLESSTVELATASADFQQFTETIPAAAGGANATATDASGQTPAAQLEALVLTMQEGAIDTVRQSGEMVASAQRFQSGRPSGENAELREFNASLSIAANDLQTVSDTVAEVARTFTSAAASLSNAAQVAGGGDGGQGNGGAGGGGVASTVGAGASGDALNNTPVLLPADSSLGTDPSPPLVSEIPTSGTGPDGVPLSPDVPSTPPEVNRAARSLLELQVDLDEFAVSSKAESTATLIAIQRILGTGNSSDTPSRPLFSLRLMVADVLRAEADTSLNGRTRLFARLAEELNRVGDGVPSRTRSLLQRIVLQLNRTAQTLRGRALNAVVQGRDTGQRIVGTLQGTAEEIALNDVLERLAMKTEMLADRVVELRRVLDGRSLAALQFTARALNLVAIDGRFKADLQNGVRGDIRLETRRDRARELMQTLTNRLNSAISQLSEIFPRAEPGDELQSRLAMALRAARAAIGRANAVGQQLLSRKPEIVAELQRAAEHCAEVALRFVRDSQGIATPLVAGLRQAATIAMQAAVELQSTLDQTARGTVAATRRTVSPLTGHAHAFLGQIADGAGERLQFLAATVRRLRLLDVDAFAILRPSQLSGVARVRVLRRLFRLAAAGNVRQTPRGARVEVLAAGIVHEAFAVPPAGLRLVADITAPRMPPQPLREIPPTLEPNSKLEWIAGHWNWDVKRRAFVWVTGVLRRAPENRRWISGKWRVIAGTVRWFPGRWVRDGVQRITLPNRPQQPPREIIPNAPSPDHFWRAGQWVIQGKQVIWRKGAWVVGRDDRVWSPSRVIRVERGWRIVEGHWDYPLSQRGRLFAPVFFAQTAAARVLNVNNVPRWTAAEILRHLFIDRTTGRFVHGVAGDAAQLIAWHNAESIGIRDPLWTFYRRAYQQDGIDLRLRLAGWHRHLAIAEGRVMPTANRPLNLSDSSAVSSQLRGAPQASGLMSSRMLEGRNGRRMLSSQLGAAASSQRLLNMRSMSIPRSLGLAGSSITGRGLNAGGAAGTLSRVTAGALNRSLLSPAGSVNWQPLLNQTNTATGLLNLQGGGGLSIP